MANKVGRNRGCLAGPLHPRRLALHGPHGLRMVCLVCGAVLYRTDGITDGITEEHRPMTAR